MYSINNLLIVVEPVDVILDVRVAGDAALQRGGMPQQNACVHRRRYYLCPHCTRTDKIKADCN